MIDYKLEWDRLKMILNVHIESNEIKKKKEEKLGYTSEYFLNGRIYEARSILVAMKNVEENDD